MKKLFITLLLTIPFIGFGQNETKIEYWDNGQLLSQIHYLDGNREGSCRYWYKNGQIESNGTYKYTESGVYSMKDGDWKYYYDNGKLQRESIIKDGVEDLKFYDKEGNLLPEGGC